MCEILAPVGTKETFYTAIKSGCDAVYFGLPRFNARLRAENISMDNLSEVVTYAHLHGVKCYITLNTLLTNKEICECIDMVRECLRVGVDAFIVQDMGLIYVLKSIFPEIILHGSTQMGVHNIRGARVLKDMGLTRVVLSRECTIADIKEIKENVDIELEVFVQGAMCVGFSGNCYFSSIKNNASGNRGECKQLCRLKYSMSDGREINNLYPLSIRDNCMLDYLSELYNLKISSLKIEGRLRHSGYVGVCTSTYRRAVDLLKEGKELQIDDMKNDLYRVFARGKYIPLYNDGNNVIESAINNHLGKCIGEVVACTKFKDMYKITISTRHTLSTGDGLKFGDKEPISMGVGNVEKSGNNCVVYGKNYIPKGSKVYLSLDSEFEKSIGDFSRRKKVSVDFSGFVGNSARLIYWCDGVSAEVVGDVCEVAKVKGTQESTIVEQLTKWGDAFDLGEININIDDIYIPLSKLNEMRRRGIVLLVDKLAGNRNVREVMSIKDMYTSEKDDLYGNMLMGDESFSDFKNLGDYTYFILSPKEYSLKNISNFLNKYKKRTNTPLILNLPIIARWQDIKIIDEIVDKYKNEIVFMANNLYVFDYIKEGARVCGGYNLNIINDYSYTAYKKMGAITLTTSIEKMFDRVKGCYKYSGKGVLMTMAHCPYKTLYNNDCGDCKCNSSMVIRGSMGNFKIRRYTISNCYFEIVDDKEMVSVGSNLIIDKR